MADHGAEEVRAAACSRAAQSRPVADEQRLARQVVLEAETTNQGALRLYSRAGFLRDKRLCKYYLSGADAYRLKLLLPTADAGEESLPALPPSSTTS